MTPLRRKRLLLLATRARDHRPWYSQYCVLSGEGLTGWTMGSAWLTDKGRKALEDMQ